MPKGIIAQFDEETGKGIIEQESGSMLHFHRSSLAPSEVKPGVGDHVTFDIDGSFARNITILASYGVPKTPSNRGLKMPQKHTGKGPAKDNVKVQ